MAYDMHLADRVREYLAELPGTEFEEKKMFSGLAFLVHGKMCINISGDNLMCRFDPAQHETIAERRGYRPVVMKGKELAGYCYVDGESIRSQKELAWWVDLCLAFNARLVSASRAPKKNKPKS